VGIEAPADVPWHRLSHLAQGLGPTLLRLGQSAVTCRCGQPLVEPCLARFNFASGAQSDYLLAQCKRCHTVFWEQVACPVGHDIA